MFKNKPVTLIIASALMIILVVVTGLFQFVLSGNSLGMVGGRQGNFQPGEMPEGATPPDGATMPEGGTPPGGGERPSGGNFQPGAADGNMQGFQGGNFSGDSTSMKLMQLLRGFQIGAAILIMLLGILSVVGMMLNKKWGPTWAIITAILVALAALPNLFQRMMGLTLIETLAKIVLAIAIIVICFLPRSHQAQETVTVT